MALQLAQAFVLVSAPSQQIVSDLSQIKNATMNQIGGINVAIGSLAGSASKIGAAAVAAASQFQLLGVSIASSISRFIGFASAGAAFFIGIRDAVQFETALQRAAAFTTGSTKE